MVISSIPVSPAVAKVNSLIPSEDPTIASDTSKRRIVLIAALVGVVVAGVAVYIKHLFDTTVKDKNELEKLTGTTVLAYIADREV